MPMATLPRFKCEATIACIWLSQQLCAARPRRKNLCAASCATAAELPSPKITTRSAFIISLAARSSASASSTDSVFISEAEMSAMRFRKMSKQRSFFSISPAIVEVAFSSAAMRSFSSWQPSSPRRWENLTTVASPHPHFWANSEMDTPSSSSVCARIIPFYHIKRQYQLDHITYGLKMIRNHNLIP